MNPDQPHRTVPVASEASGEPARQRASFAQTVGAVLWGFFGVRKERDLERDASSLNPVHLIVMGIAMAAMLVIGLLLLVRFILQH